MSKTLSITTRVKKSLWVLGGFIALGLGIIGIVLPLLPTTPFILLAAYCFIRGSQQLHTWLESHPWWGHHLRLWNEKKAITKKTRRYAISYLWLAIGFSLVFVLSSPLPRIILLLIGTGVTLFLMRLKTLESLESVRT